MGPVLRIASDAGRLVLKHYGSRAGCLRGSPEGSPVTAADLEADRFIRESLAGLRPGVPCVSEEGRVPGPEERRAWREFWLVDPLDGTKEFLARNGEFTVNVALIRDDEPVLGVVCAPALGALYYAGKGAGAWKVPLAGGSPRRVFSREPDPARGLTVLVSRSHRSDEDAVLARLKVRERVPMGSSLKFCRLAEGAADLYLRPGPTMEWDTAAGDCVYRNSGPRGIHPSPFRYNGASLRQPGFMLGPGVSEVLGAA